MYSKKYEEYDPLHPHIVNNDWWQPIVEKVRPMVESSQNMIHAELEVHYGKIKTGKFENGVTNETFYKYLSQFQFSPIFQVGVFWEPSYEFIYENGARIRGSPFGITIILLLINKRISKYYTKANHRTIGNPYGKFEL